ncbi:MAG: hypothetical protein IJ458_04435 [Clostridia bacterium]|nr:hypothetical protein [Clostridia bacterium]
MTFEQYKQGLKEVAKNKSELDIKLYNANVADKCDFKVSVGDLVANIEKVRNTKKSKVGATIRLSPGFVNNKLGETLIGIVTIINTYDTPDLYKPIVEELAKFRVDHNAELTDGTNLKMNTYIQKDYGRVSLHLMPDTDINNLIVKLDLTQEYMNYPVVLKALLNCNIIENEQSFTK